MNRNYAHHPSKIEFPRLTETNDGHKEDESRSVATEWKEFFAVMIKKTERIRTPAKTNSTHNERDLKKKQTRPRLAWIPFCIFHTMRVQVACRMPLIVICFWNFQTFHMRSCGWNLKFSKFCCLKSSVLLQMMMELNSSHCSSFLRHA